MGTFSLYNWEVLAILSEHVFTVKYLLVPINHKIWN